MIPKRVLLIGSTGGVGGALATRLMASGYHVIGTCRTRKQQKYLLDQSLCHTAVVLDLSRTRSITQAFQDLKEKGVETLAASINCAAITQSALLEHMQQADFERIMQVNVAGTFHAARLSLPLLKNCKGRLIFIGSSGGDMALPALGAYSASKFALEALADTFRRELAGYQVPVSLIKPGAIKSNMTLKHLEALDAIIVGNPQQLNKQTLKHYRAHRARMAYGYRTGVEPDEVATTVFKALQDKQPNARYMVGAQPTLINFSSRLLPDRLKDRLLENIMTGESSDRED